MAMAESENYRKGAAMRRQLMGDAAVEASANSVYADPVMQKFLDVAIENVFGERALNHTLLVSSTKSMTGHLLGGAGGLEAVVTILAMQHQIAPPTMNLENVDPECRLNYVANKAQSAKIDYALSNSFGFGGTNGSLVFKRWGAN